MKSVIKKLEFLISSQGDLKPSRELDFYTNIVNKNLFHNKNIELISESDLFLSLYHTKTTHTFLEDSIFVESLVQNNIFNKDKRIICVFIGYLNKSSISEIQYFLEYLNCLDVDIISKMTNVSKINDMKQKLPNDLLDISSFAAAKNIKIRDLINFIDLYSYFRVKGDKLFDYLKFYVEYIISMERKNISNIRNVVYKYQLELQSMYNLVYKYQKNLEKEFKNNRKIELKRRTLMEARLEELKHVKENDYLSLNEDEKKYFSIDLLESLEKAFIKHNTIIIDKLERKLLKYSQDRDQLIENLFKELQLSYSVSLKEKLKNSSLTIEELKEKMMYAKKYSNLSFDLLILFLIEATELQINFFEKCVLNGYCSSKFIESNYHLFLQEESILKMEENINLIRSYNLNCQNFDKRLLLEREVIEKRLNLFYAYQLAGIDISIIFENGFFDMVDIWIELGIYHNLKQNIDLIKDDYINITKRIVVAMQIGLSVFNENGGLLSNMLSAKKFGVNDECLDSSILSVSNVFVINDNLLGEERMDIENNNDLDKLYKISSLEYCINNKIISRNKVLRNYACSHDILSSIIYGSYLSLFECEAIINDLENELNLKKMN